MARARFLFCAARAISWRSGPEGASDAGAGSAMYSRCACARSASSSVRVRSMSSMPDVCGRRSSSACTAQSISAWSPTMLSRMIGGGAGACCACCCACSSSSSSSWGLPAAQKIMCPQTRSRAAGLWLAGKRRCGAPPVVCGGSKRPSASRWGRCSSEEVLGAFAPSTSGTQRPGRAEVSDRGFPGPSTHLLQ